MKTILEKAIVTLENVDFSYNGEPVLKQIHLAIRKFDFMGVIGPNGGGKSTLLKLILGLIKPDSGTVKVLGGEPEKFSSAIGYVPQNVNINADFPITALDVVLMGLLAQRKDQPQRAEARRTALDILDRLNMTADAHKKIGELSGGQRQRVFIARAMMTRPQLLLLDEPTASIDTRGQARFYELLQTLNKEIAIVVVGHDLFAISNYVKSVACVNKGLHYHSQEEMTGDMLETMYACSVEDECRVHTLRQGLPQILRQKQQGKANGHF